MLDTAAMAPSRAGTKRKSDTRPQQGDDSQQKATNKKSKNLPVRAKEPTPLESIEVCTTEGSHEHASTDVEQAPTDDSQDAVTAAATGKHKFFDDDEHMLPEEPSPEAGAPTESQVLPPEEDDDDDDDDSDAAPEAISTHKAAADTKKAAHAAAKALETYALSPLSLKQRH